MKQPVAKIAVNIRLRFLYANARIGAIPANVFSSSAREIRLDISPSLDFGLSININSREPDIWRDPGRKAIGMSIKNLRIPPVLPFHRFMDFCRCCLGLLSSSLPGVA